MSVIPLSPPLLHTGRLNLSTIDQMTVDHLHRWYVLYTRGRQEKQLAFDLNGENVAYFLPVEVVGGSKRNPVERVMFPSYMFLYGTIEDRYAALKTNRVIQVVDVADQHRLQYELLWLHRILDSGCEVKTSGKIVPGILCEVVSGAMRGHRGEVVAVSDDKCWVSMEIRTLGQRVLFKVPAEDVSSLDVGEVVSCG